MSERKCLYSVGDKVRIINYGHLLWQNNLMPQPKLNFPIYKKSEHIVWYDIQSSIVGKEGIISQAQNPKSPSYAIDGIKEKHAWYNESQLELVKKNPNNE